jgi:hypothetical protein
MCKMAEQTDPIRVTSIGPILDRFACAFPVNIWLTSANIKFEVLTRLNIISRMESTLRPAEQRAGNICTYF